MIGTSEKFATNLRNVSLSFLFQLREKSKQIHTKGGQTEAIESEICRRLKFDR